MKIVITNKIVIYEATEGIINYCKTKLTFKNPEYEKKKRMGFWCQNIPRVIRLYDYYQGVYYLPIGCFNDIFDIHPYPTDYSDLSIAIPTKIVSNIKLREYQKPCPELLKKAYTGLFILPAGCGKTITALECIAEVGQKTLWLTHTQDLLNQAKRECESNMICKTSTITAGECDFSGDIVFATIQTLSNIIDKGEIGQTLFGMIVADECQHVIISTETIMMFQKCVNYFASRYKIGLTATLHTSSGLHKVIPKLIGDVLYEMKKVDDKFIGYSYLKGTKKVECSVEANLFQIPAQIYFVKSNYSVKGREALFEKKNQTVIFSTLISDIANDVDRNNIILNVLKKLEGSTIVVSDRTSQLKYLSEFFGEDAFYVDGKTSKKVREEGLDKVRNGEIKYLFASYSLICEGFNAPILENLVMATPVKDLRIVVQSIGRVQRPYKDKKIANVYDIVDDVGKLDRFIDSRKRIYKREKYKMVDYGG